MLSLPFINVLEAASAAPGEANFTGLVRDPAELLRPEVLRQLEAQHDGVFAYLAYHAVVDIGIAGYVKSGALTADTGRRVMVLYTASEAPAAAPFLLPQESEPVRVDRSLDLSCELVRRAFASDAALVFPGILFIERFSVPSEPLFVSLGGVRETHEVAAFCRSVLALAAASHDRRRAGRVSTFADELGLQLAKRRIRYVRGGRRSFLEWLLGVFHFAREHRSELLSVTGLFR